MEDIIVGVAAMLVQRCYRRRLHRLWPDTGLPPPPEQVAAEELQALMESEDVAVITAALEQHLALQEASAESAPYLLAAWLELNAHRESLMPSPKKEKKKKKKGKGSKKASKRR